MKNSRNRLALELVLAVCLACMVSVVFAAEEVKVTGVVVASQDDPGGKLAPVAIQSENETMALADNPVARKIAKNVGKKLDITGSIAEVGGKKVLTPWMFTESGVKEKPASL